ncbi:MAG: hypothetical protein ACFFCS_26955 [Candidatus Hodarchaeota archaeon]
MLEMEQVNSLSKRDSQGQSRKTYLSCPTCKTHYKCKINTELVMNLDDGVARILIAAPCGHKFLAFIDGKGNLRGCERVDFEGVTIEIADADYIRKHIAELEAKHEEASDSNYNEAFELMKEINKLKQDLKKFGKGIEIR